MTSVSATWTSMLLSEELCDGLRAERRRAERASETAALLGEKVGQLKETVRAARRRNCALRDWSGAIRATLPGPQWTAGATVRWMRVEGELDGRDVWAQWEGGRLSGDPRLLTHARLLVDLGTVFVNHDPAARVRATLEGPPAAIMLTVAHACDHVTSVDFECPAQAG
ncbi:MAG TPA: hypothetical protein VKI64_05235 [Acidimicrobiales bacterium]|nr:hypothetical protein [Acidimicrobiales bacterium]